LDHADCGLGIHGPEDYTRCDETCRNVYTIALASSFAYLSCLLVKQNSMSISPKCFVLCFAYNLSVKDTLVNRFCHGASVLEA
jgi:hypothetical protein